MPETLFIEVVDRSGGQGAPAGQPQRGPSADRLRPGPPPVSGKPSAPKAEDAAKATRERIASIQSGAEVAGAAAQGSVFAAVSSGISKVAASLGPLGVAAVGVTAAMGVAAIAVRSFVRAIESQVQQLAGFSGAVAASAERTAIQRQLNLIERGQRLGPSLARAEGIRSRFEGAMFDLQTEVLRVMLELFNAFGPAIELLARGIEGVADGIATFQQVTAAAIDAFVANAPAWLQPALRAVADFFAGPDAGDDMDPMVRQFIQAAADRGPGPGRQFMLNEMGG